MKRFKTAFIVLLILAALTAAYVLINKIGIPGQPEPHYVIMPQEEYADNPVLFKNADGTLSVPVIDKTNAKQLISSIKRPDNMLWECKSTIYSSSASLTRLAVYKKSGKRFRVDVKEADGSLKQTVIYNGGKIYSKLYPGGTRTTSYSNQYEPEALMGIPDLNFFLQSSDKNFTLAELRQFNGESVIYIEYEMPEVGMTEKYYISLYYGVVLKAEAYDGARLVYSAETTGLSKEKPNEAVFSL